jgi:hypothetical protein
MFCSGPNWSLNVNKKKQYRELFNIESTQYSRFFENAASQIEKEQIGEEREKQRLMVST